MQVAHKCQGSLPKYIFFFPLHMQGFVADVTTRVRFFSPIGKGSMHNNIDFANLHMFTRTTLHAKFSERLSTRKNVNTSFFCSMSGKPQQ